MKLIYKQGAPGPPPRPGLVWHEETSRWRRPKEPGEESEPHSYGPKYSEKQLNRVSNMFKIDVDSLIHEGYKFTNPNYGITVNVIKVLSNDSARLAMGIHDAAGNRIGDLERKFYHTDKGEVGILHELFRIDAAHQNAGLAGDLADNVEAEYLQQGIKEIRLNANMDVGGYAWARQGYDFDSGKERKRMLDQLSLKVKSGAQMKGLSEEEAKRLGEELKTLKYPWAIAAWDPLNEGPGKNLGKWLLLGADWYGKKVLDPDSKGFKAGEAYRRAKKRGAA